MTAEEFAHRRWHPDFDASYLAPLPASKPLVMSAHQPIPSYLWGSTLLLGNFDGMHVGHRELLSAARRHAALLGAPLGMMSCEPHPKQFFEPEIEPFRLSSADAKTMICSQLGVDLLFMPEFNAGFAGQTPQQFIADTLVGRLCVKAVVVGEDFRFGIGRSGAVADLRRFGKESNFDVLVVPNRVVEGGRISSTRIRSWIRSGDLEKVNTSMRDAWITKIMAGEDGLVTFEKFTVLPPAGRYAVSVWNDDGRRSVCLKLDLTSERTAKIEAVALKPGLHLITDWRKCE
ncbi:hypothetical protein IB279_29350 [Ensifer sp. ENS06]|uniref:hypothetical protein n=1 Tax=Ensifer sp. ENS06 TaxID=2769276 RepID=UPI0017849BF4|nr:hypothetical protein [Ensifer sp. ENS06]MBD9627062.1 hypothetical protein [Ensifer sp. ENS06]